MSGGLRDVELTDEESNRIVAMVRPYICSFLFVRFYDLFFSRKRLTKFIFILKKFTKNSLNYSFKI